jgi:hypothetical protein
MKNDLIKSIFQILAWLVLLAVFYGLYDLIRALMP